MMRREVMSSAVLLASLFYFFLFVQVEVEARRSLLQYCPPSACGEIQNIRYPFRLKSDPSGCGDHRYELSCENNNSMTLLEENSRRYYVKSISYGYPESTIRVVDINVLSSNCSLPYRSLKWYQIFSDGPYHAMSYQIPYYSLGDCLATFVNCSKSVDHETYRRIPCMSGNTSNVYVLYGDQVISDLEGSCSFITTIPIDCQEYYYYMANSSLLYLNIHELLLKGFQVYVTDPSAYGYNYPYYYRVTRHFCSYLCSNDISCNQRCRGIIFCFSFVALSYIGLVFLQRIILAVIIFMFIIHIFRKKHTTLDTIEKFLRNQHHLMPKRYSFTDIIGMTNHFREKLGQGGFGSVYKGQLPGGLIAIKMLGNSNCNGEDFINEVATIGRIHHVHVVKLIGFCSEGSKRALVYEYMPHGSLDKYIFSKEARRHFLSWEKLHDIAVGTAKGIEYLHRGCDMCILHFDIKPHNILLDHNFTPKISDFGLSKLYPKEYDFVSVSTTRGTIGYIAPELISRNFGVVSDKSDVYSFGMLLIEMAGGRKNVDVRVDNLSEIYFPSWVYDQLHQGRDLCIENATEIETKIARKLCMVGLWCIQMKPVDRPSMTKVIEMLEENVDNLQMPPKPVLSSPRQRSMNASHSDSTSTELSIIELE